VLTVQKIIGIIDEKKKHDDDDDEESEAKNRRVRSSTTRTCTRDSLASIVCKS
jgi:hypothetical protein